MKAVLASEVARLRTPPVRSYRTNIDELDRLTGGGIATRQLCTLVAPPSAGKTSFAIHLSVAIEPSLPILYVSTELEQHELMARFAGHVLDRPWSKIARAQADGEVDVALADRRFFLLGSENVPRDLDEAIALIDDEITGIVTEHGMRPLVIVDYLQQLGGSENDAKTRVGEAATRLRQMAQRHDLPVVAISSVARAFYQTRRRINTMRKANDPCAYLAAAKESGEVEYESAVVLYLDSQGESGDTERDVTIAVAKARHNQVGFVAVKMYAASGRFVGASPSASPSYPSARTAEATQRDKEEKLFAAVVAMSRAGEPGTLTKLRKRCGVGNNDVAPTLAILVQKGRIKCAPIKCLEGKNKTPRIRDGYVPCDDLVEVAA